jgi:hypothetical protein
VEDLVELQRPDRFRGAAEHLGEGTVCEQDCAVLPDGEYRNRNPFEHHQRRQLLQGGHR